MSLRDDANYIVNNSIEAVLPDKAVIKALQNRNLGDVYLVSVGKAAWTMADAASKVVNIKSGIVITKYDHVKGDISNTKCYEAGHPISDENTYKATDVAIDMVSNLSEDDTVLFLLSGGGSALFEKPKISKDELEDINKKLLASGASITEINTIRKRLSAVKGGKFAKIIEPAKVFSIVLSDIIGDPLDMIASGPCYPDSSTDAVSIAKKYNINYDNFEETPKEITNVKTVITGSVRELCTAVSNTCISLGYSPIFLTDRLDCEAKEAGRFLSSIARTYASTNKNLAIIAGGETVVHVTGTGKGGRNQELALSAAKGISGLDNVCIFSFGSDGTDGPTDAAGGYVDGNTYDKNTESYIDNNDAYNGLKRTNGLIITGPTGTNVNDASVILIKHD